MNDKNWQNSYLRLHPAVSLKRLEQLYLYHTKRDELYEIDEKTESFLLSCDGTIRGSEVSSEAEFIEYCLEEGLLQTLSYQDQMAVSIAYAPHPSLRYLELQLTHRCNLKCRHCYLAHVGQEELSLDDAVAIAREFAEQGGLRLLISGGEPLLYPHLREFIDQTNSLPVYRVILTNGTLINEENISWLKVENIQFSMDGWRHGHDLLRGKGAFDRTLRGITIAHSAGIHISIATMIHQGNLSEFDQIKEFTIQIGATEWGIDVPCEAGALRQNRDLIIPYEESAGYMQYAYGGGYHGPSDGFACGRHLMTVLPNGKAVKCGFYEESPIGNAREGLIECWKRLKHIPLTNLECKGCEVLDECAGGCRFRAPHPLAPDPVMCAVYGKKL